MAETRSQKDARETLLESIVELGTKAFDPQASSASRDKYGKEFDGLIKRTPTMSAMSVLNKLIQPGHTPAWLGDRFTGLLTLLPLRPDGVRATLEFVFSVHPSSSVRVAEAATPQKQGANITQEALTLAARLLATPPSTASPDSWFPGLAPQLLSLLDGQDGYELTKVAAYVIGFGILGRKKFGAPGTPGWASFADPILGCIDPGARAQGLGIVEEIGRDGIIDLAENAVLVSSSDLALALHRLQALVIHHPNPGLTRRLLGPLLLPLWALSSWAHPSAHAEENCCLPARNLLKIYLRINTSTEHTILIIRNLLYNGQYEVGRLQWAYDETSTGDLQVIDVDKSPSRPSQLGWESIGSKSDVLVDILGSIFSADDISATFLALFSRWIASTKTMANPRVLTKEDTTQNPQEQLIEIGVLQKMMEKFPDKLVGRSEHIVELVEGILDQGSASTDGDETVAVALSLLNLVVTTPGFRRARLNESSLQSIEAALAKLGRSVDPDLSSTARNLALLIKYRDELEDNSTPISVPTNRQVEDRKTYALAMSYITQTDSPPPVRSEGLNLIQGLIKGNSPILDIPALLVLMSSLLDENEDYINLRVVKIFTQLANRHPITVTRELLERYMDANETASLDARLRFGEALLQVIERLGEVFAGETAKQVSEALVSIAGRRGRRPKTEAKQARDARLGDMRKREAEEALGGELPSLDDDVSEDEKARNEILAQIVQGWGSKRGSEDVRIRASALSILAGVVETNIGGLDPTLISEAVDLSVSVLTLEPEPESGILRRSAVILILSFVKALDRAKQTGRRLGFGLTQESQSDILRVLKYVAVTDNDGLVKLHAQDVVESLENWRMSKLLPEGGPQDHEITSLAGLSLNTDGGDVAKGVPRPRIEEIE